MFYLIAAEMDDFDPQLNQPGYVSEFKMLPKQTSKQEERIAELHQTLAYDSHFLVPILTKEFLS